MGNCVGGFKRRTTRIAPWRRHRTIVLAFLGIDGAGKTTIVKALQGEDFGTVHPTMGFSRAEVSVRKYKVTVYDLGGSHRIREIWPTYFSEIYGLVFVVDSSAASRMAETKQMVDSLSEVPELVGKPILFLLNKKDLPEALDEMQFSERFNLHSMAKRNKTDIRVEGICAVKGTGKEVDQVILEGLEWLIEKVLDNYENISKGVEQALKRLRERQAQERLERQHRLALAAANAAEESPDEGASPETAENPGEIETVEAQAEQGQTGPEDGEMPGTTAGEEMTPNGELPGPGSRLGTSESRREGQRAEEPNGMVASSRPPTSGSMSQRPPTSGSQKRRPTTGGSAKHPLAPVEVPTEFRLFELTGRGQAEAKLVEEMEMQERRGQHGEEEAVHGQHEAGTSANA